MFLSVYIFSLSPFLAIDRASDNGEVRSACHAYGINSVSGLSLYPSNANTAHSHFIIVVNQLEKYIVTVQLNYTSFW